MRVTSGFYVAALLRRAMQSGGFAAVLRRGAEEAGAIMIVARERSGVVKLYRPAPQALYDPGKPQDRFFTLDAKAADDEAIATAVDRETRFDPDVWVVEIEIAEGTVGEFVAVTTP